MLASANKNLLSIMVMILFVSPSIAFSKSKILVWTFNEVASPLPSATVAIDGRKAGVSDSLGRFYTKLDPGEYEIEAYVPGFQRAKKKIRMTTRPVTHHVELLLNQPDVDIQVSSISAEMRLPHDFSSFDVRLLRRDGSEIKINSVEWVYLTDMNKNVTKDVRDYFLLNQGRLFVDKPSIISLQEQIYKMRSMVKLNIRANVENFSKPVIEVERYFYIGRYKLKGKLLTSNGRPHSKQTLRIAYRPIRIIPNVPGIEYKVDTDNKGRFFLPEMPFGQYQISRVGNDGFQSRLWNWTFHVFGDTEIELTPRSLAELRNNEPSLAYKRRNQDPRFAVLEYLRRREK